MTVMTPPLRFAPTAVPTALRGLHAGLAGRDTTTFRAVFIGDSVMEGEGVASPDLRYMNRFEKMLRNTFATQGVRGSPGSSFLPAYYLSASLTDPVQDTTTRSAGSSSPFVIDESVGPGGRSIRLNYQDALRWDNVECTGFRVHYALGSFGVAFKVQVDGVDVPGFTNIATTGTNSGGQVTAIIPTTPGVHSIRVQTLDTGGFISVISGIEVFYDDETSGIKCYDAARSGAATTMFGPEHFKSITALGAVHAVFWGLVTNDAVLYNGVIPPDTYRANLIQKMNEVDAAISNEHTHIVMFVPQPNATFGSYTWEQYVNAAKAACASRSNAYFIDMREFMGLTVAGDTYALWADAVHMNRKGHNFCADAMMRSLYLAGGGALEPDLPYVVVPAEAGMVAASPIGKLYLYAREVAGRSQLRGIDSGGLDMAFQPHLGQNNIRMVLPNTGGTTTTATTGFGTSFTNVASSMANTAPTSTNLKTSTKRTTFTSAATAGGLTSHVQSSADIWRGNAAQLGGFDFKAVVSLETMQSGQRGFFGLTEGTAAPTNIDPLTTTALSKVGLAFALNTGNWKLIHNAAGTAPTQIDLGSSFPLNTTDVIRLHLFAKPNGTTIGYRVENLSTGAVATGTLSTNLPVATTFMAVKMWMTNNATAAAVAFNLHRWYCETDT